MYAIYGNIYHQYTPNVSIYIPAPWILWDMTCLRHWTKGERLPPICEPRMVSGQAPTEAGYLVESWVSIRHEKRHEFQQDDEILFFCDATVCEVSWLTKK